jgi:hypothetical protein
LGEGVREREGGGLLEEGGALAGGLGLVVRCH